MSQQTTNTTTEITIDLGNRYYKVIHNDKETSHSSNILEVQPGSYLRNLGDFEFTVNGKKYITGEGVKTKKSTNKICEEKKALLGRALFSIVEDKAKVDLTTLLPLSLYINDENKKEFADLLKGKYTVENHEGASKTFTVSSVKVFPESFSSLYTDNSLLKEPLYLVDIGGVDVTGTYVNGTPNSAKSFADETGMNIFFNQLARALTSELRESFSEEDAANIFKSYDKKNDDIKKIIDDFSMEYIRANIYEPLKDAGYRSLVHKLVFVGGGAKDLERYLVQFDSAIVLKDALWSNVRGARIRCIRQGNKKNSSKKSNPNKAQAKAKAKATEGKQ